MSEAPKTLNDVCEFIVDCLHATAPTQEDGYPLIRTPNIGKGRLKLDGVYRVSEETYEKWTRRAIPEENDLILAREASAGNVAIVKNGQRVCLGQRTVHLRPDPKQVDAAFLCYYLLVPQQQAALLAGETGSTAKHVNMKDIRRLPLKKLPQLDVQEAIGSILSAYDDLIENNRRRIQLLEQAARLLYKEWFVYLRFPGHEHVTITDGVPEGWEKVPLSELCTDVRESANPKDLPPDTAYIGLEHIPRRSITLNEWGMASEVNSNKFKFAEGDILFGKIRPYFHKVGFALVDGVASSDAIVIGPAENHLYHYVLFLLSSDEFVALASKTVREGSKMPRADWKFLLKSEFKLPSETLLGLYSDAVKPICNQLRNLALHNHQLAKARDLLLPRLMNGEVAV
ncbi:restriction endonuclease subunit S [Acidobacteria bacterium AH-259-D05]|nr:restriction endonuclease subunit S [Acidobacteria bacterium AH-259-D05]